jgi:hypothetical protein
LKNAIFTTGARWGIVAVETMTLSKKQRLDNIEQALRMMAGRLGDRAVYRQSFKPDEPELAGVEETSWKELEARGLIHGTHTFTSDHYQLTGLGWFVAMELDDKCDTPEFQDKFGKLSSKLKSYVKGRREKAVTTVDALVDDVDLSQDFIYNVIKADVWQHKYNRVGAEFDGMPSRYQLTLAWNHSKRSSSTNRATTPTHRPR